jgi:hypothetical protein
VAESISEQILSAIRTRLAALATDGGTACWYTPHRVYRTRTWPDGMLDRAVAPNETTPAVIYGVRGEQKRFREDGTGGQCVGDLEVFILVARADVSPTETAENEATPTADTIANRLERDVLRSLLSEPTLGGLVRNVIGEEGMESEPYYEAGWIARELRTVMPYDFNASAP